MVAWYNEHDPKAAAWLRELIRQGHIAPGVVDERSIEDIVPSALVGFAQCHFFAGIGGWSLALRTAGWPDDRPVWTGSCPCQPFSSAGKGGGISDERHLWPAFFHLIIECRPRVVFGEQVASRDGLGWLDLVRADLEGAEYAVGALDLCAAGFGAPHLRQRLFFVADAAGERQRPVPGRGHRIGGLVVDGAESRGDGGDDGAVGLVEQPGLARLEGLAGDGDDGDEPGRERAHAAGPTAEAGATSELADAAHGDGRRGERGQEAGAWSDGERRGRSSGGGATGGFWADAEWIPCRGGKARPVEPGTFPLAHGLPARVGRLRGYGNAIVAPVAEGFIRAYLDCEWRVT